MNPSDTIVAISSAVGPAARMLVRLAGPLAFNLLRRIAPAAGTAPSVAVQQPIHFDGITCPAWIYTFVGPHSYTGDDLAELHVPGSPLLARLLVEYLIACGARLAEPGEFTARAFLNGRMDLAEAEGVALTIAATHAGELRAARQLVAGELSQRLRPPLEWLTEALALIESNLDFAEEDIAFIDADEVRRRVARAIDVLDDLTRNATRFERLSGHPSFVLVGLPNAGKSTLLNVLSGGERAVVSPTAGTTRDALSVEVTLRRGLVRVVDVAGLDRAGKNEIDRQMQAHARRAVESADFVIEVRDGALPDRVWIPRRADLIVLTKSDLKSATVPDPNDAPRLEPFPDATARAVDRPESSKDQDPMESSTATAATPAVIDVSAHAGLGLDALRDRLDALAFGEARSSEQASPAAPAIGTLALTARHRVAVAEAVVALRAIAAVPDGAPELVAEHLRRAIDALGRVLGRVTPDDVLSRVFATFCVGK